MAGRSSGMTSRTDLLLMIIWVPGVCGGKQGGDERRPSGLVSGTDAATVMAVDVFVEENVISETRVRLQLLVVCEDGPAACAIAEEQARQPRRQLVGNLRDRHHLARAGRAL